MLPLTLLAHHLDMRMIRLFTRPSILHDMRASPNVLQPLIALIVVILKFGQSDRTQSCRMGVFTNSTVERTSTWRNRAIGGVVMRVGFGVSTVDGGTENIRGVGSRHDRGAGEGAIRVAESSATEKIAKCASERWFDSHHAR